MKKNQSRLKNLTCKYKVKSWFIAIFAVFMILSCTQDIENLVGPSYSGYTIGLTAQYGGVGIVKGSLGSATIRAEVVTAAELALQFHHINSFVGSSLLFRLKSNTTERDLENDTINERMCACAP